MTPEQKRRAQRSIALQLSMVEGTLAAMRRAGLTEDQSVQLDFFFYARSEERALELVAHLEQNDCLSLTTKRASGLPVQYVVEGKTFPTPVNKAVLSEWLPWIIVQGIVRDCEFDGFGAEI